MAKIEHACIDCGAIRNVDKDKVAAGKQLRCLKCNSKNTSKARKKTTAKRFSSNAPRYRMCDECMRLYFATVTDEGFCSGTCKMKTDARGETMKEAQSKWLKRKW